MTVLSRLAPANHLSKKHCTESQVQRTAAQPRFEVNDWLIDNRRLMSIVRIRYGTYAGEA